MWVKEQENSNLLRMLGNKNEKIKNLDDQVKQL